MPNLVTFRLDWGKVFDWNLYSYKDSIALYNSDPNFTPVPEGTSIYTLITLDYDCLSVRYNNNIGGDGVIYPLPWWVTDFQFNITINGVTNVYDITKLEKVIFILQPGLTDLNFTGGNLLSQFIDFNFISTGDFYNDGVGLFYYTHDETYDYILTSVTVVEPPAPDPPAPDPPTPDPPTPDPPVIQAPLYSNNSLVFYSPHSQPSCGVGSSVNSRYKSRRI